MTRAALRLLPALSLAGALLFGAGARAQSGEEVPFITTPDHVTLAMLRLAGVGARDHVIDLGSGDGRIVITAARRFGARGLGVEIVPELVQRSRDNARRAGVAARARFEEQDLFATDLSRATVITMYLLPEVNMQLRPKLLALAAGTRIVSHDWDLGDWLPDQTWTVDVPQKTIGREKLSRLHLWVVPASVPGRWCGRNGTSLRLQQSHQWISGEVEHRGRRWPLQGRLDGAVLRLAGAGRASLSAQARGGQLQVRGAMADWKALAGMSFVRADREHCATPVQATR